MTIGGMSGFMDELAAESRSTRDSAFNALDAVNRDSRRAGAELAAKVAAKVAEQQAKQPAAKEQPDASGPSRPDPSDANRFAPEDEWELAGPDAPPSAPIAVPPAARRRSADDDDDDFPATWLR